MMVGTDSDAVDREVVEATVTDDAPGFAATTNSTAPAELTDATGLTSDAEPHVDSAMSGG